VEYTPRVFFDWRWTIFLSANRRGFNRIRIEKNRRWRVSFVNNFVHVRLSNLGPIRAALTFPDLSSDTKFSHSQSRVTLSLNILVFHLIIVCYSDGWTYRTCRSTRPYPVSAATASSGSSSELSIYCIGDLKQAAIITNMPIYVYSLGHDTKDCTCTTVHVHTDLFGGFIRFIIWHLIEATLAVDDSHQQKAINWYKE